jgi:hypothetical protein
MATAEREDGEEGPQDRESCRSFLPLAASVGGTRGRSRRDGLPVAASRRAAVRGGAIEIAVP